MQLAAIRRARSSDVAYIARRLAWPSFPKKSSGVVFHCQALARIVDRVFCSCRGNVKACFPHTALCSIRPCATAAYLEICRALVTLGSRSARWNRSKYSRIALCASHVRDVQLRYQRL